MIQIIPSEAQTGVTKIRCRECGEKLPNVCLGKTSEIKGLYFHCKRCGKKWEILSNNETVCANVH